MKHLNFTTRISLRAFLFAALLTSTTAACAPVQPAAQPAPQTAAATVAGLEIVDPWARAAAMKGEGDMQAMGSSEAMTDTTLAGDNKAMGGSDAMTDTSTMSSTTPMGGSMGMGVGGAMSAIYMTIHNTGGEADRLIKAQSDAAQVVELHTMEEKDGVMSMHPVDGIDVPASGDAELKPGGFHVMLIGLTRDLTIGEQVTVTLTFEKAGDVTLEVEVRERK